MRYNRFCEITPVANVDLSALKPGTVVDVITEDSRHRLVVTVNKEVQQMSDGTVRVYGIVVFVENDNGYSVFSQLGMSRPACCWVDASLQIGQPMIAWSDLLVLPSDGEALPQSSPVISLRVYDES